MVIRINKTKNYVVMSNEHLRRNDMSLKAKGLLSLMLSLPEEWIYSIDGLCSLCMESEMAIKSALKELKEHGYLTVKKVMPTTENGGRISYEYNIYELPQEIQGIEKQGVENLPIENQGVENKPYINNRRQNKDIENISHPLPLKNQAKFFEKFPSVVIDSYSPIMQELTEEDWGTITDQFEKSEWLRVNIKTLSQLLRIVKKILAGSYAPFKQVKRYETAEEAEKRRKEEERQKRLDYFNSLPGFKWE